MIDGIRNFLAARHQDEGLKGRLERAEKASVNQFEKRREVERERDGAQHQADDQHRMVGEIHTELEQTREECDEWRQRAETVEQARSNDLMEIERLRRKWDEAQSRAVAIGRIRAEAIGREEECDGCERQRPCLTFGEEVLCAECIGLRTQAQVHRVESELAWKKGEYQQFAKEAEQRAERLEAAIRAEIETDGAGAYMLRDSDRPGFVVGRLMDALADSEPETAQARAYDLEVQRDLLENERDLLEKKLADVRRIATDFLRDYGEDKLAQEVLDATNTTRARWVSHEVPPEEAPGSTTTRADNALRVIGHAKDGRRYTFFIPFRTSEISEEGLRLLNETYPKLTAYLGQL